MNIIDALILGIIQGITEWLPISSEGMVSLFLTSRGMPLNAAIPLAIFLHTGTLLAAAIYFRSEIRDILSDLPDHFKRQDTGSKSVINFLIISTFFTGVVGLPVLLFSLNELDFNGKEAMAFIGVLLIVTGLLQKKGELTEIREKEITTNDSIIVGILQGFAAMPGLSRSGLTTSGLLLRKYDAGKSLRLSFLMSIPAVFVAEIGLGIMEQITFDGNSIIMVATSFIVGYLTIGALINITKRVRFSKFCILLGVLSILPLFFSV
jgi:undecaprenyl-diphosphatase